MPKLYRDGNKAFETKLMSNPGLKHCVIGIRHALSIFKNAGLVEEDKLYPADAVVDLQEQISQRATAWYKIGARRGAQQIIDAFIDGSLTVERQKDGTKAVVAHVNAIKWKKRLSISTGNTKTEVRTKTYKLSTKELGFE